MSATDQITIELVSDSDEKREAMQKELTEFLIAFSAKHGGINLQKDRGVRTPIWTIGR